MKICIVTSYPAIAEPRAPRHALAAQRAFPNAEVLFVDLVPESKDPVLEPELLSGSGILRMTQRFPTRRSGLFRLITRKLYSRMQRLIYRYTRHLGEGLFGDSILGLTRTLQSIDADAYIAHNIETLLPAMHAANGRPVIFDCMEYYSDMGASQSQLEAEATRELEQEKLGICALVIASSETLAHTLEQEYRLEGVLPSCNVPPSLKTLPARHDGRLNLYWRNSVIGFGQRGLEDALTALQSLPEDIHLYVQGRMSPAQEEVFTNKVRSMSLAGRVTALGPYEPHQAVHEAARWDIGLCLERHGPRNHELTVSNKMFDYHMGGLATVSSDLPGLRQVIERSQGGALFTPGDPASLAAVILRFYESPELLANTQANARQFALTEANLEAELTRLANAMHNALASTRHG